MIGYNLSHGDIFLPRLITSDHASYVLDYSVLLLLGCMLFVCVRAAGSLQMNLFQQISESITRTPPKIEI